MSAISGYDKPCKYGGRVWIENGPGSSYTLFVDGSIKAQSENWDYIVREFNSYVA